MARRWAQSLGVKLFAAFALVATLGIGTLALTTRQVTERQFTVFVSQGRLQRAAQSAAALSNALQALPPAQRAQAWNEIGDLIQAETEKQGTGQGGGLGRGGVRGRQASAADRTLVVDAAGQIVYDSEDQMVGQTVDPTLLDRAAPITVDDGVLGYLLLAQVDLSTHSTLEAQFLDAINRATLWAALLTVLASTLAVALLSRQLVSPLRRLTGAAESMSAGDLSQRVPVRTRDEIGELGQAFNHMAADLQAADTQRRQMTADIAHELRNPLSVIRGNLEAMLDGLYPTDAEHLTPVHEETLLLQRRVEDLRLLSLAEAGQLSLARTEIDVGRLLESIADGARAVADDQGLSLRVEPPPEPLRVEADQARLRQVLGNLVGNALRYTPPGGEIVLKAQSSDNRVQFVVSDNGPGIPPEDLPHVFDRFYRGATKTGGAAVLRGAAARASKGSGLGLPIAQALVRAHQGTISVESEPGRGARFIVDLPRL